MHKPLEIAALVSGSKSEPKSCGAGRIGRASTSAHRTRGGLIKVPTGWANASRQGLCGTAGVPIPVNTDSPLALPTEDRILLYFSDFRNMEERYVLPQALTQKAIAFAAGIQRKHLSRYLDEMTRDGYLVEMKAHIEGEKQRMLAYYLAPRGWERAVAIKERLSKIKVPVVIAGVAKDMTIQEVLEDRTGIYRAVAEEALEDGPITEDERELLEALRKKLGLSARDCREIEAEIGKPAS